VRPLRWSRLAGVTLTLLAAGLVVVPPVPAGAISAAGGTLPFAVNPAPLPDGSPQSYFNLTVIPGQSAQESVVVTNASTSAQAFNTVASRGQTTITSGDGYLRPRGSCSGAGCWISGLPATVKLAAGARQSIPFTVTVPKGTPPSQYLAGVSVWPVDTPAPVQVGSNGNGASAQARVVSEVDVGVAVTVGTLTQLRSQLSIRGVTTASIGTTPRIVVSVANTGQTFVHATGAAIATVNGKVLRYPVDVDTILPGQGAVLPVNALGFSGSNVPVEVQLQYADGQIPAIWRGALTAAAATPAAPTVTRPGAAPLATANAAVPAWAGMLIAGLIVLVALALAALVRITLRNRRRHAHSVER
jgi:hypothetical protein